MAPYLETYHKWYSPNVGREFEMLIFGHAGRPLIIFPTSQGRYYQNKDFGLISAIESFIDQGKVKVYCPDSYDAESFYNYAIHPAQRLKNHMAYERLVLDEVLTLASQETSYSRIMVAGCSFGGYHAFNFAMKYPWRVSHTISLGGIFNIKQYIYGYYDENCYFNDPVEYMPGLSDPTYINEIERMKIIIGTGSLDMCREDSLRISQILSSKKLPHLLDDRPDAGHDWPWWKEMIHDYFVEVFG
jgi:esterase/lipase superfamily enzyme